MKYIAPALLIAYAAYSATIQITIAHSIILFSLAGLFAFNQFLLSRETPRLSTEIEKLKKDLEGQIQKQKEIQDVRIKNAEDEVSRVGLANLKSTSAPSKPEPRKFNF